MRTFTQKLAFLLVTLLCCIGVPIQATEVTIGDPTSTSFSYNFPAYCYYNYSVSQQIYTASEIGEAGTITSVSLWLKSFTGSDIARDLEMYMVETDKESFSTSYDWVTLSSDNLVYSGLVTFSTTEQKQTFTLENPFSYSGSGNLLIAFRDVTGGYVYASSSGSEAKSFSGSEYLTLYANRDDGEYDVSDLSSESGTRSYSRCVIELDITASGSGPSCDPVDQGSVVVTDITANSAVVNWTGGTGTYLLEYKLSSADKWTAVENLHSTSYTLTGLTSNSAYNVKVSNVCGEENTSPARSASFNTLIGLPYLEKFSTSSIPSGWSRYTGDLNADGSAALTTSSSYWSFGTYNGVFDSHAHIEVYQTRNAWLVSPTIPMEAAHQLSFNLALTYWTGNSAPAPVAQPNARFVVLASTDGSNWNTLREWNNTGSEYVFDNITCSAEGEDVEIDLSAYGSQNIQIAFYVYNTGSGDNRIHVDNVKIAPLPTCLKPTDLHEIDGKATKNSVQVGWTVNTGETAWKVQYKKASDPDSVQYWSTIAANDNDAFTISGLDTYTEYNVKVAADCGGDDLSDYCKPITVKTAAGVPFSQGFNKPSLPSDWKRYSGLWEEGGEELEAVSAGWAIAGSSSYKNGVFPDSTSHLYLNVAGTDTKHWIVSPMIEMEAGYQLSFNLALTKSSGTTEAPKAGAQNDDKFIVAINDGTGWTSLRTWDDVTYRFDEINATAAGQTVKFDLSAYDGKSVQIAFYGESTESNGDNNLHISAVKIEPIPACQPALSLNITGIEGTTATAAWTADETGTWQYGYKANPAEDFVPVDTDFENETSNLSVDLTELSQVTDYVFFVRRKCNESTFSAPLSVKFHTIQTPVVVDGEHAFSDNFESGNQWLLINGEQTNQWVLGTAASNGGGTRSLYISNDGGTSNAYAYETTYSRVYATKTFHITEAGVYTFSYDWKNNGSSSAYLRVYLAPASEEPAAGSSPSSSWKTLHSASSLYGKSEWQQESFEYRIDEAGYYKVILYWYYSSYSTAYNPPAAVDNFAISRLACPKPEGLSVSEVGAETASLAWDGASDGSFEYAYALASAEQPTEFTPVAETSVTIENLDELTDYKFYLRKSCGDTEKSVVVSVSFSTGQKPAAVGNSFSDDFEDGIKWLFANGSTNKWVVDTAAHYGEGSTKALYISNDGGKTNAYSNGSSGVSYATKLFSIAEGSYNFQYDWKSYGNDEGYDFMRVALVPNNSTLPTSYTSIYSSSLPSGWIALDGGSQLQGVTEWQHFTSDEVEFTEELAGEYKVVFVWRNDGSVGTNPPAAVDNFSITKVACQTPIGLKVVADSTTTTSAVLTWTKKGMEANWLVRYRKAGAEEWNAPIAVAHITGNAADSLKLEGLDPSSTYEAQVAAVCDPDDEEAISEYSAAIRFNTECAAISALNENFDAVTTGTGNILPLCWRYINTSTYSSYNYYPKVYGYEANSGSNCMQFYSYYSSSTDYDPQDQYAVLPEMTSVSDKRIKFNAKAYSTSENYDATFIVGVMSDPENASTFVPVKTHTPASTNYEPVVIPLNTYTGEGKYIAIKIEAAYSSSKSYFYHVLYIDDVVVEDIPSCLEVGGLAVELTQGNGTVATLSWSAGADETAWVVEYSTKADFSEAVSENVSETPSLNLSGLTPETVYYARVKAVCGVGNESVWSDAISFKPTNVFSILVNEGTTTGSNVPFSAYYADGGASHSQFIIPAADLASVQWGTINELTFYASQDAVDFEDDRFEVYIAETEATDVTSTFTAWTSMTKVKNASAVAINGGEMVITLDAPFAYEGGNLLVGFKQTAGETYASAYWYGVNATSGSSSYSYYNTDYGYTYGPYTSTFKPKMKIGYTPGEAPSCIKPTALAVELTEGNGSVASLSWTAGGEETAWVVEYSRNEDFSDAASVNVSGTPAADLSELVAEKTYYARVKAVCGEELESEYSSAISFKPTNAMALTINRGTITNGYIPVYGFYADFGTHSQFIVPADSLAGIQWGTINQLTFYSSNTNIDWSPAQFEVYMAEVEATTVSELADWSSMEKVMNSGSLSIAGGLMKVSLDAPYLYQGGNLLIGVHQVANGDDYSCSWYGVSAANASFEAHGSSMTAAPQNFLPKMKIDYVPGEEPSCYKPTGLSVKNITDNGATFFWNRDEATAWQYAVLDAAIDEPDDNDFVACTDTFAVVTGKADNTDYVFYLRKNCGSEDGLSQIVSAKFRTKQTPAAVPFADDFEDGNKWIVNNGNQKNVWVVDTAAHNGAGSTKALYVSNDGGQHNTYTGDYSYTYHYAYATKSFTFEGGNYTFKYDWKAIGASYSSYGYMRVALAPDSIEFTDGQSVGLSSYSTPTGWVALDGGSGRNGQSDWTTFTSDEITVPAGTYKVVFLWYDYYYGGTPAAIDNFSITKVLCAKPTALSSKATAHTATLKWKADEGQDTWQIAIDTISGFNPDTLSAEKLIQVTDTSYVATGLLANKYYYAYVRAICGGDNGNSAWSSKLSIATAIANAAPTNVVSNVGALTATQMQVSWKGVASNDNHASYEVYYSTSNAMPAELSADSLITGITDTTTVFTGLSSETAYFVWVRDNCGVDGYSAWTSYIRIVTASNCQTPTGVAASEIALNSAKISWNTFGQSAFNLRYKVASATDWTVVNNVDMPHVIEGLRPSTSYQVQVQAACQAELETPVWSASGSFKTVYGTPFEEKFDASSIPADWSMHTGLLSEVQSDPTKLISATSGWLFGTKNSIFNSHAYVNIWSTDTKKWLATPAITLTEDVQLTFDLALTKWSSATAVADSLQQDDKFVVLISTDNGATWTILREWNNTGSEYVYNEIDSTATGEEVAISLNAYTGQSVKIAFYGESTKSDGLNGGDNALHIDNVLIDKVPTCLKPSGLKVSDVYAHTAKLAWTAGEEGQNAWQIALDTIAAFKPDTLSNLIDVTENPYVLNDLLPQHTYYVYVRANCGEEDGVSRWTDVQSFRTTIACPAPTGLKATLTPGNGAIATLEWKENGLATDWRLEYSVNADLSDSTVVLATDTFVNLTNLTSDQKYYARVAADCGELDGESLYSSIISFTPTDRYEFLVNDGTTTNGYVPVYGYYVDHFSTGQFIVPASQLADLQWDSIQALTFYSNANHNFGAAQFEAYVAEVEETTFASNSLNDWEAMNLVKAAASLSIADGKMVVTFDEPYQYEGGNLMIGIKQTVVGTATTSSYALAWYGVYASSAAVGGYKNKSTGAYSLSKQNFLPKMLISYVPGVEPACKKPSGLVVDTITAVGATLSWDKIEGATWEYAVRHASEPAPETFTATVDSFVVISNLMESSDYTFYLRRACGEDGYSRLISIDFTTDILKASLPFSEDFEEANSGWKFVNGEQTNKWMIGNDAAYAGEQSLYVSSNGTRNTYDKAAVSASYAYVLLDFSETDTYVVKYNWRANGDYNAVDGFALDYMRVVLIPNAASVVAGDETLPDNAIALDIREENGEQLEGLYWQNEWQSMEKEVSVSAGLYKLVVAWFNDDDADFGEDYPGAIDNISIIKKSDDPTGINGIGSDAEKAVKFIHEDKIFIRINGAIYDATGRRVR